MPGETTTAALADSLPTMRMGARTVLEQKGRMRDTVDRQVLGIGVGLSWSEVDFAKITGQSISETTDLIDNPQALSDSLTTITPSDSGIHVLYTDRVADRIIGQSAAILRGGSLAMNAMLRKQDLDGITQGQAASQDLGTAGNPLTSNLVRAAKYRISSNTTEPGNGPYHMQAHGFSLKDIEDEIVSAVGTYEITRGVTAEMFSQSFVKAPRMVGEVEVHENGNIPIDASDDAEAFVYDRNGIILVEGRGMRNEVLRRPNIGGGATSVFAYFEYAYGFRASGNWQKSITADALNPA